MAAYPYTEREWNHLIRQGGPDGWSELGGDLATWKPKVERICARHGLSPEGEMRGSSSGATVRCSNTVFLIGDVAVKVFTRRSPIWFLREVESLRFLGDVPEAKTPRLLAYGDAISDDDPDHPYLIMERLPGEPYAHHQGKLSIEERRVLAAQVPEFLAENLPHVTEEFRPCLLSADLHVGHSLIEEQSGAWRVTGHIDLGDAEVGPVEYEWVPLCPKAFLGNETLMRAFFTAYGWPLPVAPEVKRRLKLYTVLHRFPPLRSPAREAREGPSLEAILDAQWPI